MSICNQLRSPHWDSEEKLSLAGEKSLQVVLDCLSVTLELWTICCNTQGVYACVVWSSHRIIISLSLVGELYLTTRHSWKFVINAVECVAGMSQEDPANRIRCLS